MTTKEFAVSVIDKAEAASLAGDRGEAIRLLELVRDEIAILIKRLLVEERP